MAFLEDVKKCINEIAEVKGADRNYLIEKKVKPPIKVQLQKAGSYLLYDFEKVATLFPFFAKTESVKGLNAIADYVLLTEKNNELWAIYIEVKKKGGNPQNQLYATKQFITYLICSINRQCKKEYRVNYRGLAYSKLNRPTTNPKNPFDRNNIAYITGDKLNLSNYLQ